MMRTARALYVEALDVLLKGRMAEVAVARDWDLLEEVARLATQDASPDLAVTDSSLFVTWREAVTKYHLKGWSNMTPERVRQVRERAALAILDKAPDVPPEEAAADIEARSDSVRFAVANNAIEGGYVLPETEATLDEWARGEIDDDELMEQTLKRFGPGV